MGTFPFQRYFGFAIPELTVAYSYSAKIENSILCNNVRIGEKAQIKDCELGAEYEVEAGADLKGERLTAGEEA